MTRDPYRTIYHRDGTVTLWDCHRQQRRRTGNPSAEVLATLDHDERARVMRHTGDAYLEDALDYLNAICDHFWQRMIGHQTREEFARLAFDAGQEVGDAWSEALANAETL